MREDISTEQEKLVFELFIVSICVNWFQNLLQNYEENAIDRNISIGIESVEEWEE